MVSTYVDHDSLVTAVKDIDTVFFVSGFEAVDRVDQHKAAIDAFVQAGVQRVVYTSFVNCAADSTFTLARDHYHTEQHMQIKGLPFAALRNNFYADMVPLLVTDGRIRGPAGNGRFAPVARVDVADVAVAMLTDPSSPTGRFDVTGPELVTMEQAAARLTEVTATGLPTRTRHWRRPMLRGPASTYRNSRSMVGSPATAHRGWRVRGAERYRRAFCRPPADDAKRVSGKQTLRAI